MELVNRSALMVMPAEPFLDWLHRVDPTSAHLTLDDLRREPTIDLLPEWDIYEEALENLADVSNEIFEEQLDGWYRVPSLWTKGPGLERVSALVRMQFSFHGRRCL